MRKQFFYFFIILVSIYLILTIYMYISKDANFSLYYNFISLLIFLATVITTVIGIFKYDKLRYSLTLIILILLHICIRKYVFMGSQEKFLYTMNQELYNETTIMIINKKLKGYVNLTGPYKKLSKDFTQVVKKEKLIKINYGIFSTFSTPGQIVYTSDMETMLKTEKKYCFKYEVLNKNWVIFYY